MNQRSGTVTPINTATNKAGKPIKVGFGPLFLAIKPNGKTVYVADGGNSVTPINVATNKPGKPINIGFEPFTLAVTPDGKTVYVVTTENVVPIATATNTAGKPITVRHWLEDIVVSRNGRQAYVLCRGYKVRHVWHGTVTPISTRTNRQGPFIPAGHNPIALAVSGNGKTLYVARWPGARTSSSALRDRRAWHTRRRTRHVRRTRRGGDGGQARAWRKRDRHGPADRPAEPAGGRCRSPRRWS